VNKSAKWDIEVGDESGNTLHYRDSALEGDNDEAVRWLGQFIHE
jgi:hypothetical protein